MNGPEEEAEAVVPVLCEECSGKMTDPKNWLGVGRLEAFDCLICHSLFCSHLRGVDGQNVCVECVNGDP